MTHHQCIGASLQGIEAVRKQPDKIFCARYDDNGRENACYTLFCIIPHDKEVKLHEAISSVLWPEEALTERKDHE